MVQWTRVHLPIQGTWDRPLAWEDATCCRAMKACVLQLQKPMLSEVCESQLLSPCAETTEAHAPRAHAQK